MPSSYVGDQTATEAPSAAPEPQGAITVSLPVDGDPPNAATFIQAYKVLADFIAWLMDAFAKPSAWTQKIQRWRNARLQERSTIDHMGFRGGRIIEWIESWSANPGGANGGTITTGANLSTGTTGTFWTKAQDWFARLVITGSGGDVKIQGPGDPSSSTLQTTRSLLLHIGTGNNDFAEVVGNAECTYNDDASIAMEWDLHTTASINGMRICAGLANALYDYYGIDNSFVGAMIYKANANANWMCVTGDGTTLGTPASSGVAVAASTNYKMRIEWWGVNVADNSTQAVRFYINGTLVATSTASLPNHVSLVKGIAAPTFSVQTDSPTASSRQVIIGPVRFAANF